MQASMLDIPLISNQCHGFWRQINLHILPVVWSFAHWVSHNAKSSTLHLFERARTWKCIQWNNSKWPLDGAIVVFNVNVCTAECTEAHYVRSSTDIILICASLWAHANTFSSCEILLLEMKSKIKNVFFNDYFYFYKNTKLKIKKVSIGKQYRCSPIFNIHFKCISGIHGRSIILILTY